MSSHGKRVTNFLMCVVLTSGLALAGCGKAADTDEQQATPTEAVEMVSVEVIGPDANGEDVDYVAPMEVELSSVEDAWALTQLAFDVLSLEYDAENSTYGVLLNSITSPVDGTVLAYDEAAGTYWQLFVDGEASEVGIDGVELKDGTSIVWYYSAFGDALPEGELPVVDVLPNAA